MQMLTMVSVASFQGLPRLQFLIACSMQKQSQKSYHVIRSTGITFHQALYVWPCYEEEFCTSYKDETSADREQHQVYKTYLSWKA